MSWKGSWGNNQKGSWGKGGNNNQQQWPATTAEEPAWKKAATGQGNTPKVVAASWAGQVSPTTTTAKTVAASVSPAWKQPQKGDAKGGKGGWQSGKGKDAGGKGAAAAKSSSWTAPTDDWDSWMSDQATEFTEKAKTLAHELQPVEGASTQLLNSAKALGENDKATASAMKASVEVLEKQQTKLSELQKTIGAETTAARKAGPAAAAAAADLGQLLARVKGLWQGVSSQINLLKPKAAKIQNEADMKVKENKDAAGFRPVLAKLNAEVVAAMKAYNAVSSQAASLVSSPPEEGEARDTKISSIEASATEAMKALEALKKDVHDNFWKNVRDFAPEAKKNAGASLDEVTKKLSQGVKACNIYRRLKTELPKLVENQKTLTEVTQALSGHESAITQAGKDANGSVTKEKVAIIDGHLDPVMQAIRQANASMNKMERADAVTMENIQKLRARGDELKKKVEAVIAKIKVQRDVIKAAEAVPAAQELLEKAEAAWSGCQDAEMPFLMGVEVLPTDDNDKAIEACKVAGEATGKAVASARGFVRARVNDCKGYEKELGDKTAADLSPIMKKIEEVQVKHSKFSKDMNDRRVGPLLAAAIEAVKDVTNKVKAAEAAAKALDGKDLEEQSSEAISALVEKTKASVGEARTSMSTARSVAQAKQKESKAQNSHPSVVNINDGLAKAKSAIDRISTSIDRALQLVKTQSAITTGQEKVKEAEALTEKGRKLVPTEDKPFTLETVTAVDEAFTAVSNMSKAADISIQGGLKGALPKAKAELQKLSERRTAVQAALAELKAGIRDRREGALSASYLAEAETKTKATEDLMEKADKAEQPFLIGASLDLKATQELLATCSAVAKDVNEALSAAKEYNNGKINASKQFREAAAKKVKDGFAEMAERCKKVTAKLATFESESRERSKDARMTEAVENTDALDALVKKTVIAAEPFQKEGSDQMSEADAEAPLKVFMEAEQEYSKALKALTNSFQNREKDQKGKKPQLEILEKLRLRVNKAKEEVAEKRKGVAPHEKRALAKNLLAEAKEQVVGLAAEVKKVADACAPLVDEGGEQFLISISIQTLCSALRAHMKEKELTEDALFQEIGKGKDVSAKAFVKYLTGLPEAIGHDELNAFSDERRQQIFKRISSNDKSVTKTDFAGMFQHKYYCARPTAITNQFEVEGSETVCKVDLHAELMLLGPLKTDAAGLTRSECKMDDKTGWVTVSQRQAGSNEGEQDAQQEGRKGDGRKGFGRKGDGKGFGRKGDGRKGGRQDGPFLKPCPIFKNACYGMHKAIDNGFAAVQKVTQSIQAKMKVGGPAEQGSLKEAREEMAKLKTEASESQKSIEELKRKYMSAEKAFAGKEQAEKNAHIEARNKKEAAPFLADVLAAVEALGADAKAAEEAAAPMSKLSAEELKEFATPASVQEAVEKLAAAVKEKSAVALEMVKTQTKAAADTTPQTPGTTYAKNQLGQLKSRLEQLARVTDKARGLVSNKCRNLIAAKLEPTAEAIRNRIQKEGKSIEEFFDSLKQGDKIPEVAFCKLLQSLELDDSSLSPELAKLLCRKLEVDGISRDAFTNFVVVYYKVLKTIAFTDDVDISKCKTLRKLEEGDVVEVLEGPQTNEANGMTRIRAKACKEPHTVGWLTVSGSQGTAFLQKTTKPKA